MVVNTPPENLKPITEKLDSVGDVIVTTPVEPPGTVKISSRNFASERRAATAIVADTFAPPVEYVTR